GCCARVAEASSSGFSEHVGDGRDELLAGGDRARPEAVTEEVAPAAMSEVERLRVVAVQELHPVGELLAPRLDHEVVVVAHQAERVAAPLVLRDGDAE